MTSIPLFLNHLRYAISVKGRDEMAVTYKQLKLLSKHHLPSCCCVALIRTVSFFKGILFHKGRIIKMVNVAQSLVFISQMGGTADGKERKKYPSGNKTFALKSKSSKVGNISFLEGL